MDENILLNRNNLQNQNVQPQEQQRRMPGALMDTMQALNTTTSVSANRQVGNRHQENITRSFNQARSELKGDWMLFRRASEEMVRVRSAADALDMHFNDQLNEAGFDEFLDARLNDYQALIDACDGYIAARAGKTSRRSIRRRNLVDNIKALAKREKETLSNSRTSLKELVMEDASRNNTAPTWKDVVARARVTSEQGADNLNMEVVYGNGSVAASRMVKMMGISGCYQNTHVMRDYQNGDTFYGAERLPANYVTLRSLTGVDNPPKIVYSPEAQAKRNVIGVLDFVFGLENANSERDSKLKVKYRTLPNNTLEITDCVAIESGAITTYNRRNSPRIDFENLDPAIINTIGGALNIDFEANNNWEVEGEQVDNAAVQFFLRDVVDNETLETIKEGYRNFIRERRSFFNVVDTANKLAVNVEDLQINGEITGRITDSLHKAVRSFKKSYMAGKYHYPLANEVEEIINNMGKKVASDLMNIPALSRDLKDENDMDKAVDECVDYMYSVCNAMRWAGRADGTNNMTRSLSQQIELTIEGSNNKLKDSSELARVLFVREKEKRDAIPVELNKKSERILVLENLISDIQKRISEETDDDKLEELNQQAVKYAKELDELNDDSVNLYKNSDVKLSLISFTTSVIKIVEEYKDGESRKEHNKRIKEHNLSIKDHTLKVWDNTHRATLLNKNFKDARTIRDEITKNINDKEIVLLVQKYLDSFINDTRLNMEEIIKGEKKIDGLDKKTIINNMVTDIMEKFERPNIKSIEDFEVGYNKSFEIINHLRNVFSLESFKDKKKNEDFLSVRSLIISSLDRYETRMQRDKGQMNLYVKLYLENKENTSLTWQKVKENYQKEGIFKDNKDFKRVVYKNSSNKFVTAYWLAHALGEGELYEKSFMVEKETEGFGKWRILKEKNRPGFEDIQKIPKEKLIYSENAQKKLQSIKLIDSLLNISPKYREENLSVKVNSDTKDGSIIIEDVYAVNNYYDSTEFSRSFDEIKGQTFDEKLLEKIKAFHYDTGDEELDEKHFADKVRDLFEEVVPSGDSYIANNLLQVGTKIFGDD